jgi:hypothetical protein
VQPFLAPCLLQALLQFVQALLYECLFAHAPLRLQGADEDVVALERDRARGALDVPLQHVRYHGAYLPLTSTSSPDPVRFLPPRERPLRRFSAVASECAQHLPSA